MADATPSEMGSTSGPESARQANPDPFETSGHGASAGDDPAESGEASARPAWSGVTRPAGWLLSGRTGEAAPPARPGTEPARPDAAQPAASPSADNDGEPVRASADWTDYPPADETAAPASVGDPGPGGGWYDEGYYTDPQPTRVHQIPRSWLGTRNGAPPAVVGPTAALQGRAGGPGFAVPPGAVAGLYDPAQRSGWQLAQGLWEESGISWETPAAEPRPEPGWDQYAPAASPGHPSQDGGWQDYAWQDSGRQASPAQHGGWQDSGRQASPWQAGGWQDESRQDDNWQVDNWQDESWQDGGQANGWQDADQPPGAGHDGGPQDSRMPLGAPTFAPASESDELFQAWQGSVRQAAARPGPRMSPERRRQAWHVVRVGVPVAVLVTVGAGAVMMLTGKTNGMLAGSASDGTPASGAADSAVAFTGYPGQRGAVTVNSIATAAGTGLAVGSADGHPAIWRRAPDGTWTLVSAAAPALFQRPGMESLTSVAHGPAGWIAVGGVVSGTAQQPIVVTSSDGVTWHAMDGTAPFAGPGTFVMGVTASQHGYVVVGMQVSGGRTFAALWWSADLRNWVAGSNGGLDGRLESSTVYSVGVTPTGFVAAGTHGDNAAIWTSADGRNWGILDVSGPAGAPAAALHEVAVNGTHVVVAGYWAAKGGDLPLVVASTDSGSHWRQVALGASAGSAAVTALTAAGNGFVATGLAGPAGAQHAVTWSSPDGLTWSAATPVNAGQITALTAMGSTVSGTAQRGSGSSVVTLAELAP